jgi:hypothetical protein
LANKLLQKHLGQHGFLEDQHMPSLWRHISHPIWFILCVNDFGFKYIGDENLKHLCTALCTETYKIVEDWAGNLYCGINLEWNYDKQWVDFAMLVYAIKTSPDLTIFHH